MDDFTAIYTEYAPAVYRFALALCRDTHLAEEITQETFFKALKHKDAFRGQCQLRVWLCQIAKNTYFTHYNKQKRALPEPAAAEYLPEEQLLARERTLQLHAALHALAEPYKEVFTLRVFGELSYAQIAALFEKTEGWARVTFYRAKEKLITQMEDKP